MDASVLQILPGILFVMITKRWLSDMELMFLGVYLRQIKTYVPTSTRSPKLTAALQGHQPRVPSAGEWTHRLWRLIHQGLHGHNKGLLIHTMWLRLKALRSVTTNKQTNTPTNLKR